MIDDRDADAPVRSDPNDARGVIDTAFDLLDHVAALQPARLIDLSETTGIPRATVHRLLKQLIAVGAVRRDGTVIDWARAYLDWVRLCPPSGDYESPPVDRWPNWPPPPARR